MPPTTPCISFLYWAKTSVPLLIPSTDISLELNWSFPPIKWNEKQNNFSFKRYKNIHRHCKWYLCTPTTMIKKTCWKSFQSRKEIKISGNFFPLLARNSFQEVPACLISKCFPCQGSGSGRILSHQTVGEL